MLRDAERLLPSFRLQNGFGVIGETMTGKTEAMKTFTVAAVMLALIAVPAQAQLAGKRPHGEDRKSEQKKPQVDDAAYKAALERIPEPKEKYDPWGVARPAEPAKEPAKKTK